MEAYNKVSSRDNQSRESTLPSPPTVHENKFQRARRLREEKLQANKPTHVSPMSKVEIVDLDLFESGLKVEIPLPPKRSPSTLFHFDEEDYFMSSDEPVKPTTKPMNLSSTMLDGMVIKDVHSLEKPVVAMLKANIDRKINDQHRNKIRKQKLSEKAEKSNKDRKKQRENKIMLLEAPVVPEEKEEVHVSLKDWVESTAKERYLKATLNRSAVVKNLKGKAYRKDKRLAEAGKPAVAMEKLNVLLSNRDELGHLKPRSVILENRAARRDKKIQDRKLNKEAELSGQFSGLKIESESSDETSIAGVINSVRHLIEGAIKHFSGELIDNLTPWVDMLVLVVSMLYTNNSAQRFGLLYFFSRSGIAGASLHESLLKSTGVTVTIAAIEALGLSLSRSQYNYVLPTDIRSESLSDHVETVASCLSTVIDSSVGEHLKTLLLALTSHHIFGKEHAKAIYYAVGKPKETTLLEWLRSCVEAIINLIKAGEAIACGVPVAEAFCMSTPLKFALNEARELNGKIDMIYTGLPTPGFISLDTFINRSKTTLDIFEKHMKIINPYSSLYKECSVMRNTLSINYSGAVSRASSGRRATPMAICLHGSPGIGKSNVLQYICDIWAIEMGYEPSPELIYPRIPTTDFWDGYLPYSHPITHYSEMGNSATKIVQNMGEKVVNEITSIVDSVSYACNMAPVELKGKFFFNSKLVITDTNNEFMNCKETVKNWEAFMRRFLFIEMVVKPEYCVDGSCMLDYEKSKGARFLDKWNFKVYRHIPKAGTGTFVQVLLGGDAAAGIDALTDFLRTYIREFVTREEAVIAQSAKPENIYGTQQVQCEVPLMLQQSVVAESYTNSCFDAIGRWAQVVYYHSTTVLSCCRRGVNDAGDILYLYNQYWRMCAAVHIAQVIRIPSIQLSLPGWLRLLLFVLAVVVSKFSLLAPVYTIILFVFSLSSCSLDISSLAVRKCMRHRDRLLYDIQLHHQRQWNYWIPSTEHIWTATGVLLSLGAVKVVLDALSGLNSTRVHTEGQTLSTTLPVDLNSPSVGVQSIERMVNAGFIQKRVSNTAMGIWNDIATLPPVVHTSAPEGLIKKVMRNVRHCTVEAGGSVRTCILGIYGDVALINKHAFRGKYKGTLRVYSSSAREHGASRDMQFDTMDIKFIRDDLYMIRVRQLTFSDIRPHIYRGPPLTASSGSIGDSPVKIFYHSTPLKMKDPGEDFTLPDAYAYEWVGHEKGLCGTPLFANLQGGTVLIGLHTAGAVNGTMAFAQLLPSGERAYTFPDKGLMVLHSESTAVEFATEDPLPKSPVFFEDLHNVTYYGKLPGAVMINKYSKIQRTKFPIEKIDTLLGMVTIEPREFEYAPPMMRPTVVSGEYVSPYNNGLRKLNVKRGTIPGDILQRVRERFMMRFKAGFDDRRGSWAPATLLQAINGEMLDPFFRRVNASTSGGYGFPGPKAKYLPLSDDEMRTPTPELEDSIVKMLDKYLKGERAMPIYTGSLKDEPRLQAKVKSGKTRLFYGVSLDFLLVSRMMLSPLFTSMVERGEIFGSAVGINMFADADAFYHDLNSMSPFILEGDFQAFDTSIPYDIKLLVCTLIADMCKYMGYNDDAMTILRGVLTDDLFPILDINKDIFCVPGMQPSGKYGTAEVNCLINLCLFMTAWYMHADLESLDFFQYVRVQTYGDDVANAVHPSVRDRFNCVYFATVCDTVFNMKFTTSDKGDSVSEYIPITEMSFLKRTFRYHPEFGCVVAPLSVASCCRMMQWQIPSPYATLEDQTISMLTSLCLEITLHATRNQFNIFRRNLIKEVAYLYDIPSEILDKKLPTFDKMMAIIGSPSQGKLVGDPEGIKDVAPEVHQYSDFGVESESISTNTNLGDINLDPHFIKIAEFLDNIMKQRWALQEQLLIAQNILKETPNPMPGLSCLDLLKVNGKYSNVEYDHTLNRYIEARSLVDALTLTIERYTAFITKYSLLESESDTSDMKDGPVSGSELSTKENMTDMTGAHPTEVMVGSLRKTNIFTDSVVGLNSFFSRPVPVYNFFVSMGTNYYTALDVWSLYLSSPSVRAKLRNYSMLRGNLHVRVAVSGMQHHYGRLLYAYVPRATSVEFIPEYSSRAASQPKVRTAFVKYLSQTPGAKFMDIRDNMPMDMMLPYVSPQSAIRLYNNDGSALSAATAFDTARDMGTVYLITPFPVNSTQAGSTPVDVYVYAWMSDVELGCPTATVMEIQTESADERETGPVEKIATNVVSISKALSVVPWLRPFALASTLAAQAVGIIASHFGWSYPLLVEKPSRMKNCPYQNGANTIGTDTGFKLSCDPKQELSISPAFAGVDVDELTISHICNTSSLLTTFPWQASDAPLGAPLVVIPITPTIGQDEYSSGNSLFFCQPSALSFAATPFAAWRGDITLTFDFACAFNHRGKVAIICEPNVAQRALINSGLTTTKQYMQIVDIQETQQVSICVNWMFPREWADVIPPEIAGSLINGPIPHTESYFNGLNGYITVVPLTKLQSPDGSYIRVLVSISSDNMAFARPTQVNLPTQRYIISSESGDETTKPVTCFDINPTGASMDHIYSDCYGEGIFSFRSLLKRFHSSSFFQIPSAEYRNSAAQVGIHAIPELFPIYNNARIATDLLSYLRYAFLCMRGSIRKRVSVLGINQSTLENAIVNLEPAVTNNGYPATENYDPISNNRTHLLDGSIDYVPSTNGGIEFEVPFYSSNLFVISANSNPWVSGDAAMNPVRSNNLTLHFQTGNAREESYAVITSATGEDFTLARWIAAPPFVYASIS